MNHLDYMFKAGFFGTRAPFFMDMVTLIVAVLPLLVTVAIMLAKNKHYKAHAYAQILIFAVSVIVVGYFEYGVRVSGGFDAFMEDSLVPYTYALVVLIFHIAVATVTLVIWAMTIFRAKKQLELREDKKSGIRTFIGVVMTSLTGIWVYLLMFVY